jgi:ribosomal protein S18 acetylase RimI-like enzyme
VGRRARRPGDRLLRNGPTTDDDAVEATAEIFTIYIEPDAVGTGAGRALFVHATDDFRRRGFAHATLWVLASNTRTRRFYEAGGWRFDGSTKSELFGEWPLDLARYRISLAEGADASARS